MFDRKKIYTCKSKHCRGGDLKHKHTKAGQWLEPVFLILGMRVKEEFGKK